jgi:hypothetical protein
MNNTLENVHINYNLEEIYEEMGNIFIIFEKYIIEINKEYEKYYIDEYS